MIQEAIQLLLIYKFTFISQAVFLKKKSEYALTTQVIYQSFPGLLQTGNTQTTYVFEAPQKALLISVY